MKNKDKELLKPYALMRAKAIFSRSDLCPECVKAHEHKEKLTPSRERKVANQILRCTLRRKLQEFITETQTWEVKPSWQVLLEVAIALRRSFPELKFPTNLKKFRQDFKRWSPGKKQRPKKWSALHVSTIFDELKKLQTNPGGRAIHQELSSLWQEMDLPVISVRTIQNVIKEHPEWDYLILGRKTYVKENKTTATRIAPQHAGTAALIDGSPWNKPFGEYNHATGRLEMKRVQLITLMDGQSLKVTGFGIDDSENINPIMAALKMSCDLTGYLPKELIRDNASAFNTQEYKNFRAPATKLGFIDSPQKVGNSTGKSGVESLQSKLQKVGMKKKGHLGQGARTKGKYSRKSNEVINEQLKNLPTRAEVIKSISEAIAEYNNTDYDGTGTPNEKFAKSEKPHAIRLEPYQVAELFWLSKRVKVSQQGQIKIKANKKKLIYILSPEDKFSYAGKEVLIKYDTRDTECIYAFSINKTQAFLFKADRQRVFAYAKVEQNDTDRDAIREIYAHNKKWESIVRSKIEEQEAIINEIKTREEVSNWMNTRKDRLKRTQEDAQMARYVDEYYGVEERVNGSDIERENANNYIKTKKTRYDKRHVVTVVAEKK